MEPLAKISTSVPRMAALVTRMRIVRTMTDRTLVLAKMVLLEMEQLVLILMSVQSTLAMLKQHV